MIEIKLGTKQSILLAIECFIDNAKIVMEEPIDKEELIINIESIFRDEEKQKFWISKSFPQKRDVNDAVGETERKK